MRRTESKGDGRKAIKFYVLLVLLGLVVLHLALFFNIYDTLKTLF